MGSVEASPDLGTLRLRPGVPVLRRDPLTLQVGLRLPLAVQLPDRASVRALLDALAARHDPGPLDDDARHALARLAAADLLVDDAAGAAADSDLMLFGSDAPRRRTARAAGTVGLTAEPTAADGLGDLLAEAGLRLDDRDPAVHLVVTAGPARRGLVDPLLRAGLPHLLVSGTGATRRVGPFVDPGRTACVRCVDAHESETDPRLPLLIEQAAHPHSPIAPVDPLTSRLALTWAVRDLTRYLEGDEPSTWSTTVDIAPTAAPTVTRWLRHPDCGCAWDLLMHLP
ncbi:hypothetical protein HNR19_002965 [Nocardioides thalensis]|uniref:Bacteriocin biosynthesis cyclodehydratase domain-containing protein n=1 Tax=Nocardioides thalensis TaxID=1914755 RepID=A0A853C4U9_9ACTN|nr:hypothetical protein [Nocardioides thalensis]NYJ02267.1 hypothetical protein [Nocardioides thalensis]